jgi:hypothetical protein
MVSEKQPFMLMAVRHLRQTEAATNHIQRYPPYLYINTKPALLCVIVVGGGLLVSHYGDSVFLALKTVYPQHTWLEWRFNQVPKGFWTEVPNHRRFFDWAATELKLENLDGWYNVTTSQVRDLGGSGLLANKYANSLEAALLAVYPSHPWNAWKFKTVPRSFWASAANRKAFFDWLASELGYKCLTDWYSATPTDLEDKGGPFFYLKRVLFGQAQANNVVCYNTAKRMIEWYYAGSLPNALSSCYSEHPWNIWRFKRLPTLTSDDIKNHHLKALGEYLHEDVGPLLHITSLEDWYRVSASQLQQAGIQHIAQKLGGVAEMLSLAFPEHHWDAQLFGSGQKKATQRVLKQRVQELFPTEVVQEEVSVGIRYRGTNMLMKFDVYVPSKMTAFEYQGIHHYETVHSARRVTEATDKDVEKITACRKYGITLISVPKEWNGEFSSLKELMNST